MSDELPKKELREPLIKLWRMPPIRVRIAPRDMFTTVAVLQYALRNPQLSMTQKEQGIAVARSLQNALAELDPIIAKYLEMGWDPQYDTPIE